MTLNPNNVTQGGLGSRQVQAVFCRRPLLFRAGLTIFIEMEYKKVLRRYNRMRRCFERRAKERGREEGEPPKKGQTGGGVGKKNGRRGEKKNGWRGPEKKTGGMAQNLSSKVPGKCGGRDGRKNGRMGWKKNGGSGKEKKRAVRAAKKTDFEVGKKNGGEVKKKKTDDGW